MFRISAILYSIVATTMGGAGVITVLTAGYTGAMPIVASALIGALLAVPVAVLVARQMVDQSDAAQD